MFALDGVSEDIYVQHSNLLGHIPPSEKRVIPPKNYALQKKSLLVQCPQFVVLNLWLKAWSQGIYHQWNLSIMHLGYHGSQSSSYISHLYERQLTSSYI